MTRVEFRAARSDQAELDWPIADVQIDSGN
jgi:hypothetical protein